MMRTDAFLLNYKGHERLKQYCNSKGCVTYLIEDTQENEFNSFIEEIRRLPCEQYDFRRIRDNIFYTFYYGDVQVHTYYTAHNRSVRIIVDKNTGKYVRTVQRESGGKDTVLYQFELDYRKIDCGMCYIIKCCDGSFFIIDSAHMFSEMEHIRLYEFLRRNTDGDGPIMIAGWFLSHAHQDHIVKFMDFVRAGFGDVKLRDIYYNFPALTVEGAENWKLSDKETMQEFWQLMDEHVELNTIHPHTGQKFCVRNLEFTVLATHEDICAYPLDCYNNASAVLMMEAEGSRVLFLGDADYLACEEMTARYGKENLKADIVQVAHHGFNAANAGIYYMAEAGTALYATSREYFEKHAASPSNRTIMKLCREHVIAGDGTAAFRLPYRAGEAVIWPKEIEP